MMATFFWFAVAYITVWRLGILEGGVREHRRNERAERKVLNRTGIVELKDHRR